MILSAVVFKFIHRTPPKLKWNSKESLNLKFKYVIIFLKKIESYLISAFHYMHRLHVSKYLSYLKNLVSNMNHKSYANGRHLTKSIDELGKSLARIQGSLKTGAGMLFHGW